MALPALIKALSKFTGGITPYRGQASPKNALPGFVWDQTSRDLTQGIPGATAERSMGHFMGNPEPNFSYQFQGGEGAAGQGLRNVGDITRRFDQDAGFLSEEVARGTPNARPGMEVTFPPGQGYEDRLPAMLSGDAVGMTMHRGPQGPNRMTAQVVPEFDMYETPMLRDLIADENALTKHMAKQDANMDNLVRQLAQDKGLEARKTYNRTHVMHKRDSGGYEAFADPEVMRQENLIESLNRNYYERTGLRQPGPIR